MTLDNKIYTALLSDSNLKSKITEHEGIRPSAYYDSRGYITIGIGRMIDQRLNGKLSIDEINYLFNNDLKSAINDLLTYDWFNELDQVRQGVLVELDFNIGLTNVLKFVNMISLIKLKDYVNAGKELLNSSWSKQVGVNRSNDMWYRLVYGMYK